MTVPPAADSDALSRYQRMRRHLHRNRAMSVTTKIVVTLVGTVVVIAGFIMIVTPGPGLVAIAAGLAILATEWAWADRLLVGARRKIDKTRIAAAEMDPAVRRKRTALATLTTVLAIGLVSVY